MIYNRVSTNPNQKYHIIVCDMHYAPLCIKWTHGKWHPYSHATANKIKLELKTNSHLIRFARAAVSHLVEKQIKNYNKMHYYRIYIIIFGEMKENSRNSLFSPVNGKFLQLFCLIKTCRKSDYFKIIVQMTAIRLFHSNPFFFQLFSYQT